jgi:hypothetical protein
MSGDELSRYWFPLTPNARAFSTLMRNFFSNCREADRQENLGVLCQRHWRQLLSDLLRKWRSVVIGPGALSFHPASGSATVSRTQRFRAEGFRNGAGELHLLDRLLDLAKRQMLVAFGSRPLPVTVPTPNAYTVFVRNVIEHAHAWGNHFQHNIPHMRSLPHEEQLITPPPSRHHLGVSPPPRRTWVSTLGSTRLQGSFSTRHRCRSNGIGSVAYVRIWPNSAVAATLLERQLLGDKLPSAATTSLSAASARR